MSNTKRSIALLVAGAVVISFAPVFARLTSVSATTSAFYRVLFGGIILAAIALATGARLRPPRRVAVWILASAIFFAMDLAFWHRSIQLIGPGLSTILANCQVFILATVGALFLRERLSARFVIGTLVAFAGLFLVFGRSWDTLDPAYRWGVVLGGITAACYAGYLLTLRRSMAGPESLNTIPNLTVLVVVTSALLALWMVFRGESFVIPTRRDWGILVSYGLTAQVLGWWLISKGLTGMPASRAGLVLLLQPALAFVWDVLLFSRPTTGVEASGALLALAGIYLGSRR